MTEVAGESLHGTPAILSGYRRFLVRDEQYPGVVAAAGGIVTGIAYHDVSPKGWSRLDRFEGEMYERSPVTIRYDNGVEFQVFCYVFLPAFRHRLTTIPWEYETFLRSGKQVFQNQYDGFTMID